MGVVFYRAFICIWIFIGLAWFASILSIMADQMSSKVNAVVAGNESKTDEQHEEHPEKESGMTSVAP